MNKQVSCRLSSTCIDSKKPLVSIITPSFNQGPYITDTIDSVKNQQYPDIEHIIIDGGSTDDTLEIIRKNENSYNLSWISEPDAGQADAIMKGLARARGSIITWINTDDYYLNDSVISTVVHYFQENPDIDVVTGGGCWVDEHKQVIMPIQADHTLISEKNMRYADFILQPATFFRSHAIDTVKIETAFCYVFDWLLFLSMFEQHLSFLVVDDAFAAYRIYQNNKTGQDNARRKREIYLVARRNFGLANPQTIYCYWIYLVYRIAELLPSSLEGRSKKWIRKINSAMKNLSTNRIYSC